MRPGLLEQPASWPASWSPSARTVADLLDPDGRVVWHQGGRGYSLVFRPN